MKKLLNWLYTNKTPVSGLLCLLLYFLNSIFHLADKLSLPDGWYYALVAAMFLIIGYAIKGKGFQKGSIIKDFLDEEQALKDNPVLKDGIEELDRLSGQNQDQPTESNPPKNT